MMVIITPPNSRFEFAGSDMATSAQNSGKLQLNMAETEFES